MMKSRMRPAAAAMPAMAGVESPPVAESGSDVGEGLRVPEAKEVDECVGAAREGAAVGERLAGAEEAVGLGLGLTGAEVSMAKITIRGGSVDGDEFGGAAGRVCGRQRKR